ncbi:MAG: dethiobiotin synthase [Parachlamydiaceae bacterium]|nr:dethiobiotin synthase [Parachlamydiaceae bacterium]
MNKIIVAGCGTGVGKTIVSAILVHALKGEYWKPIQCGTGVDSDSLTMKLLLPDHQIYPSAYNLKAPLSPHHAAKLEKKVIKTSIIIPPSTERPLIIESVGGIFVPLNLMELSIDLFKDWDAVWIVVSNNYLGSINHTLLTIEALQRRNIRLHSIVFNGPQCIETEKVILGFTKVPCLGRLSLEKNISLRTIERYSQLWKKKIVTILQ